MDIFKSLQVNETKNEKWLIIVISLLVIFFLVYLIKRLINKKISDTDNKYKSRKIVNKLTDKYRVENAKVKSMLSLKFDENWISFTLRFVVDYKKRRTTKDILYTRILDEINKSQNINVASSSIEIVH